MHIHICSKQLVFHTSLIYSWILNDGEVISQWRALWVGIEGYFYRRVSKTFLEECFLRNSPPFWGTRNFITMLQSFATEPLLRHMNQFFILQPDYLRTTRIWILLSNLRPYLLRVFLFQTFPQILFEYLFLLLLAVWPTNQLLGLRPPRIFDKNTNYEPPYYAIFSIFLLRLPSYIQMSFWAPYYRRQESVNW